jgi:hypothetical protein
MARAIESTEVCPYCGQPFYLPSDRAEHVKVAHLDFGRTSRVFAYIDRAEDNLERTLALQSPARESRERRHN